MKDTFREFVAITKKCESYNSTNKCKRFLPMQHTNRKGHVSSIGVYDYDTKKYVLTDVRSVDAPSCIQEMKRMLEKAT